MATSMGGNVVGRAVVVVSANTSQLSSGFRTAQAQANSFVSRSAAGFKAMGSALDRTGIRLQSIGRSMSTYITLPLVGLGYAATKAAYEWDRAFTRIRAVTNLTNEEVAALEERTKELSVMTGRDPTEMAEGLYFLASAGLEVAQVEEVMEMAAKGAAIGMGEFGDVAKLMAFALNAFEKDGLTAVQVMDSVTAAIREGTAEPDEFAHAMGRLMPIAAQAGISFQELAASLATVSNIGLNVNEGATAMRGLMQALVAPGDQAADAIKKVGFSLTQVRSMLSEEGLLSTFRELEEAAKAKYGEAWIDIIRDIVPNIRALTGAFGLTIQEAKQVDGIFTQIVNSQGDLRKAWKETSEQSEALKWDKAMANLKVGLQDLGATIIPLLNEYVLPALQSMVEWFTKLSPEMKENIVMWGALAAAIGPILLGIGLLVRGLGGLFSIAGMAMARGSQLVGWLGSVASLSKEAAQGAGTFRQVLGASIGPVGAWTVAIGLAAVAAYKLFEFFQTSNDIREQTQSMLKETGASIREFREETEKATEGDWNPFDALADREVEQGVEEAIYLFKEDLNALTETTLRAKGAYEDFAGLIAGEGVQSSMRGREAYGQMLNTLKLLGIHIDGYTQSQANAIFKAGDWQAAIKMLTDAAGPKLAGALKDANGLMDESARKSALAAANNKDYAESIFTVQEAIQSAYAHADELKTLQEGLAEQFQLPIEELAAGITDRGMDVPEGMVRGIEAQRQDREDLNQAIRDTVNLTAEEGVALSTTIAQYLSLGGEIDNAAKKELIHAIITGKVNQQLRDMNRYNRENRELTAEQIDHNERLAEALLRTDGAYEEWGKTMTDNNRLGARATTTVLGLLDKVEKLGIEMSDKDRHTLVAAIHDGDAKTAIRVLEGLLGKLDKTKAEPKVDADTGPAKAKLNQILNEIERANPTLTVYIEALRRGGGSLANTPIRESHEGGWIGPGPRAARRERPWRVLDGEYVARREGAARSGVMLGNINQSKLTDAGLMRAMEAGSRRERAGGISVTVNVNGGGHWDEERLARTVSRHLARTMSEQGAWG